MQLVTIITLVLLQGLPAGTTPESTASPAVVETVSHETSPTVSCGVADLDGQRVGGDDVEALRALLEPVPGIDVVRRLALDVALATWLESGTLEGIPAVDRLAAYRRLIAEVWHEVGAFEGPEVLVARLREAAEEVDLVTHPCPSTRPEAVGLSELGEQRACSHCDAPTPGAWRER